MIAPCRARPASRMERRILKMHEEAATRMLVAVYRLLNSDGFMDETESLYLATRQLPLSERLARFRVLLSDLGYAVNTDLLVP